MKLLWAQLETLFLELHDDNMVELPNICECLSEETRGRNCKLRRPPGLGALVSDLVGKEVDESDGLV